MAKKFVKISLATKLRLVLGAALLGIIAAALVVPWYFMELVAEQGVQRPGAELTRLGLGEFITGHVKGQVKARQATSQAAALNAGPGGKEGYEGPYLIPLIGANIPAMDSARKKAQKFFQQEPERDLDLVSSEDKAGQTNYRCFRAVRADDSCMSCHANPAAWPDQDKPPQFQARQLVGMVDVTLPASAGGGTLVWETRVAFILGGSLSAAVGVVLFGLITYRLILRPVKNLRQLADKVAEGDLSARSGVKTGDELQRLGDGFNEMLTAIQDQHEQLRSANRALDLKLAELAEANVTLYKANQVKNDFLANVSHELRTPLNSIIGFADLVSQSTEEKIQRYGQNIAASSKSLLNMITDILDLAKIEAGRAQVRFDKVNVTDTCQTLIALMQPLADKKQLDLKAKLADSLPLVVTDGGKIQQILFNLLSNAIKFTPAGGQVVVSSSLTAQQKEGQTGEIHVAVADTGSGIAKADQQHIFEKFHRVDQSLTRESSGTGLGLAISKELTTLIGGRLTLDSEPGHGATFTLILPLEPRGGEMAADKPT